MSLSIKDPATANGAPSPGRPAWVWVITVFYVLSIGFSVLSVALLFSGALPLTPAQRTYFANLGPFDYMMSLGLGLLTLTATIFLFALRKVAVPLFAASLFFNLGFSIVHATTTVWARAMGGSGLIGALIGWAILGIVALYARHLRQLGVLR